MLLAIFGLALFPYGIQMLLMMPLFARRDGVGATLSALRIALVVIGLSLPIASFAKPELGTVFVTMSFALAYWIDLPFVMMRIRTRHKVDLFAAARPLVVLAAASVGIGLALASVMAKFDVWFPTSTVSALLAVTTFGILFVGAYAGLTARHPLGLVRLVRTIGGPQ